jgi:hypothetical protein
VSCQLAEGVGLCILCTDTYGLLLEFSAFTSSNISLLSLNNES